MSKILLMCSKNSKQDWNFDRAIEILSERLCPDNISWAAPLIINNNRTFIGIFNPVDSLPIKHCSVCMGNLINANHRWWEPGAEAPDGSYALFRCDENSIELVTDMVASRTIWYVQTQDIFLASTSQRAIVFFLRSFEPNLAVFPWMLSSGTLGPGFSWDQRIKHLPGNASLSLDLSSWKIALKADSVNFEHLDVSDKEHEILLTEAIEYTFDHLQVNLNKWILSLSGGNDSRAILLLLRDRRNLQCVTWGLRSSVTSKKNDAYVAKLLAEYFNCKHVYLETDKSNEPIDKVIKRFLVAGEGRISHIAGYMDGFRIWKHLYESSYQGIIRGDHAFGFHTVSSPYDIYRVTGLSLLTEYTNLRQVREIFSDHDQKRPMFLGRRENETLPSWRDRIYAEFRVHAHLAALNDLKLSYVEVINPLLSSKIIQQVRKLPDHLRNNKILFKKIVSSMSPDISFAKERAIASSKDVLRSHDIVNFMYNELNTSYAKSLLSENLITYIINKLHFNNYSSLKRKTKYPPLVNLGILTRLHRKLDKILRIQTIDDPTLAFRACIICKMNQLLSSDAYALKQNWY